MNLIEATLSKLSHIQYYLHKLESEVYQEPLKILSGASLGEHTRHILEFYQCLLQQSGEGTINYDLRQRDKGLQQDPQLALYALEEITLSLPSHDIGKRLKLEISYDEDHSRTNIVETSLERELVYNLEHVIHHLAIIKIGLSAVAPWMTLPKGFGIAPSTIRYKRDSCVQ